LLAGHWATFFIIDRIMQARIADLESAKATLNERTLDAESRAAKAVQHALELDRKFAQVAEETALHKSQVASLTQALQDVQTEVAQSTMQASLANSSADEQRKKVRCCLRANDSA
jgi:uncharacterized coiled-coil protein SlyX